MEAAEDLHQVPIREADPAEEETPVQDQGPEIAEVPAGTLTPDQEIIQATHGEVSPR